jgi:5,5'-dehydrodivanillate O-demethylase
MGAAPGAASPTAAPQEDAVLTQEENERLTRVGPGQPAGEFLRRYWLPVATHDELSPEQPTKFVRILGEDLVLFRDKQGRVGLLADHCAHRGASLCYGRVEERGIACAYHGWLYDTAGNVLETPPERNDAITKHVKQPAYPVQKFIGMYWAYLGPSPAPVIPPYDVWVRQDGRRWIEVRGRIDCNWFQTMENSVDSAHLQILHQEFVGRGRPPASTTRGFVDDIATFDFEVFPRGIWKHRTYVSGEVDSHPLLFPTVLRQGNATQIRVPIDDTHIWHVLVHFEPTEDGSPVEDEGDPPVRHARYHKDPPDALYPFTRFTMHSVAAQDHMAWETQGPITDRTAEHLAASDRGVVLLRRLTWSRSPASSRATTLSASSATPTTR